MCIVQSPTMAHRENDEVKLRDGWRFIYKTPRLSITYSHEEINFRNSDRKLHARQLGGRLASGSDRRP